MATLLVIKCPICGDWQNYETRTDPECKCGFVIYAEDDVIGDATNKGKVIEIDINEAVKLLKQNSR